MALISLNHIGKSYVMGDNTVHALRGVSLDIARGEFVALMGPSGSGKSTLMNMIGCLDQPDEGQYMLNAQDVSRLSAADLAAVRNIELGFVFQQFNLLQRQNALENVTLPLLYSAMPKPDRQARAMQCLTQVGLQNRADHRPTQLSGGQQQRVAIARALVNKPAVLLADEPTGALDSQTSLEVMALLQDLHQAGQTVVMVTHEADVAAFANRLIRLKDGQIVSDVAQTPRRASEEIASLKHSSEVVQ